MCFFVIKFYFDRVMQVFLVGGIFPGRSYLAHLGKITIGFQNKLARYSNQIKFSTLLRTQNNISAQMSKQHQSHQTMNIWVFGSAFVSISAQKSDMLADPISTFYKVGIVGNRGSS